ncbi:MAG: hypothetical protein ABL307_00675 [Roseitalea porphyridii]|uniref:hypothetical protein n=1 Tax=Roseitalea porphyridii TaxID=1852022 RepID=UPI0032D94787
MKLISDENLAIINSLIAEADGDFERAVIAMRIEQERADAERRDPSLDRVREIISMDPETLRSRFGEDALTRAQSVLAY